MRCFRGSVLDSIVGVSAFKRMSKLSYAYAISRPLPRVERDTSASADNDLIAREMLACEIQSPVWWRVLMTLSGVFVEWRYTPIAT